MAVVKPPSPKPATKPPDHWLNAAIRCANGAESWGNNSVKLYWFAWLAWWNCWRIISVAQHAGPTLLGTANCFVVNLFVNLQGWLAYPYRDTLPLFTADTYPCI